MKFAVAVIVSAEMLLACAPRQGEIVDISASYRIADIAPYDVEGSGSIVGQGFLRQQGGGVVTCAGSDVALGPDILVTERFFAEVARGNKPIVNKGRLTQVHPNAFRLSQCDAQGNFSFKNVAPGKWVIVTTVSWVIGRVEQGGMLLTRTEIKGAELKQVLLNDRNRVQKH